MNTQLTKEKFLSVLDSYIDSQNDYIQEHEQVKEILLPLIGQPINGKTLNSKRLNGLKFERKYGMFYITGKYEHLIGYENSENLIAVEKTDYSRGFEYFDNCSGGAARERIKQIHTIDKDKAFNVFSQIETHFNSLRELFGEVENKNLGSYHFPAYYDVLNTIYKEKDNKDVKLTDFYFIRK